MTTTNFKNIPFFIGIDTHLKNWTVTIRSSNIEHKTFSMNPSASELHRYLTNRYPDGDFNIVYEAGFSGFWPCRKLNELGLNCIIVNPADVPTSNKEKTVKNDPVDSRKLARELENGSLTGIYVPDIFQEQLRSLMRLRFRLVQNQTRIKNRIKGLLYNYGISIPKEHTTNSRWSGYFINWLKSVSFESTAGNYTLQSLILQLEQTREHHKLVLRQLRTEAKKNDIAPIINLLTSVPGIAFITSMSLYTELIDINRFSNLDKLCSFVGIVPSTHSSGETEYSKGITFRHNKFLRPLIVESAWVAVRKDPALSLRFHELCRLMPKQKAIIRIAKKLLRRIRHVWIHKEQYIFSKVA
jgi:transposase